MSWLRGVDRLEGGIGTIVVDIDKARGGYPDRYGGREEWQGHECTIYSVGVGYYPDNIITRPGGKY